VNEEELRQLVRESIARHLHRDAPLSMAPAPPVHPSHRTFAWLRSGDESGACVIEPAVRCSHCGYCLSYGH